MIIEQLLFRPGSGWLTVGSAVPGTTAQLVLAFGDRPLLAAGEALGALQARYPAARVVAASSAGEISAGEVTEGTVTAVAVSFEHTRVACEMVAVNTPALSRLAGRDLGRRLGAPDLVHVFVLACGRRTNGTELAEGFNEALPWRVRVTGGLAGDAKVEEDTLVGLDGDLQPGNVVAIGFYGNRLDVSCGSAGGWEAFGPERLVTHSEGNVLFELNGHPALSLYREYLGARAGELPGVGWRFPLALCGAGDTPDRVRALIGIDEARGSMRFAGPVPMGSRVRFMRGFFTSLLSGAAAAATQAKTPEPPELAICVSCVGRLIVLGPKVGEEVRQVRAVIGEGAVVTGFYASGQLAPAGGNELCLLHNQTMTITTLRER